MREIIFRGKRVDNGEWIYGDLITYESALVSIRNPKTWLTQNVEEKTIGQFIGLKDKTGNNIFEGDVSLYECEGRTYRLIVENITEIQLWKKELTSGKVIGNIHEVNHETTM